MAWIYVSTSDFLLVLVPLRPDIEMNRFEISGPIGEAITTITTAMSFVVFAAMALSVGQQLKWLAYAGMLMVVWIGIDVLSPFSKVRELAAK